jgi:hypothetical protein
MIETACSLGMQAVLQSGVKPAALQMMGCRDLDFPVAEGRAQESLLGRLTGA